MLKKSFFIQISAFVILFGLLIWFVMNPKLSVVDRADINSDVKQNHSFKTKPEVKGLIEQNQQLQRNISGVSEEERLKADNATKQADQLIANTNALIAEAEIKDTESTQHDKQALQDRLDALKRKASNP